MSLAWTSVFVLFTVELLITFLLVLNLYKPLRKLVTGSLRVATSSKHVRILMLVLAVILILLFIDSFRNQSRLSEELKAPEVLRDNAKELQLKLRIFREQRNLYLSGVTVFLGLVIYWILQLYEEFDADKAVLEQHLTAARKEIEDLRKGKTPTDSKKSQ